MVSPLVQDLNEDATAGEENAPTSGLTSNNSDAAKSYSTPSADESSKTTTESSSTTMVPTLTTEKTATTASFSATGSQPLPTNWLGEKAYILSTAALIGLATGTNIAVFKTAVEFVREALYGDGIKLPLLLGSLGGDEVMEFSLTLSEIIPLALIPAVGGLMVGALLRFGGEMPPGLRDTVKEGGCLPREGSSSSLDSSLQSLGFLFCAFRYPRLIFLTSLF